MKNLFFLIDFICLLVLIDGIRNSSRRLLSFGYAIGGFALIWLRNGLREQFEAAANSLNVLLREDTLIEFPERDVVLAFSSHLVDAVLIHS